MVSFFDVCNFKKAGNTMTMLEKAVKIVYDI